MKKKEAASVPVQPVIATAKKLLSERLSSDTVINRIANDFAIAPDAALGILNQAGVLQKKSVECLKRKFKHQAEKAQKSATEPATIKQSTAAVNQRRGKAAKQFPNKGKHWKAEELSVLEKLSEAAYLRGEEFPSLVPSLSRRFGRDGAGILSKASSLNICFVDFKNNNQVKWDYRFENKMDKPDTARPCKTTNKEPVRTSTRTLSEEELDVVDTTLPVTGDVGAFRGFDFSILPAGPIYDSIQECFVNKCPMKPTEEGAFLCVDYPTGSGKTHGVVQHVLTQMLRDIRAELAALDAGEKYDVAGRIKIVFIVNTIANVKQGYDLLKDMVEGRKPFCEGFQGFDDSQKQCLLSRMVYVPGKQNTLSDISNEDMEEILRLFGVKKNDPIRDELYRMKIYADMQADKKNPERIRTNAKRSKEESAGKVFSDLLYHLRKKMFFGQNKGKEMSDFVKKNLSLLQQLIPGVRLELWTAQAAFMTTKKFLHGVHYTKCTHSMINDAGNCWLVMDEFDRQNSEFVDYLLETESIDLIETFKKIHSMLRMNVYADVPGNEGCRKPLAQIREIFEAASKRWNLHCALHPPREGAPGGNEARLFINHQGSNLVTSLDRNEHYIYEHDTEHDVNRYGTIECSHRGEIPEDKDFINMVKEIERILTVTAPRKFLEAAKIKLKNATGNPNCRDESLLKSALDDILNHFGLAEVAEIIHRYRGYTAIGSLANKLRSSDSSFHTYGMRVATVDAKEKSHEQVDVRSLHIPISSTALVTVMISRGCKMLGVSATGYAQTVLHNFDVRYMRAQLGDRFFDLDESFREAVAREYAQEQNYDGAGVDLRVGEAKPVRNFKHFVEAWRPELPLQAKYDMIIEPKAGENNQSSQNYYVKIFGQLLGEIRAFFLDPYQRYFVGFLSFHFKDDDFKRKEFIEHAVGTVAKECGIKDYCLRAKVNSDYLRDSFQAEVLDKMTNWGGKMICLTTYQTMSVGINADYVFNENIEKDSIVNVSLNDRRQNTVDIDCVYLGPCTNIFGADGNGDKGRLHACYNTLCLEEVDEISPEQKGVMLKQIMRSKDLKKTINDFTGKILKATNDYHAAVAKITRQTTGRLGRAGKKRKHITVSAHDDILQSVAQVNESMTLANHEYQKLKDYANLKHGDSRHVSTDRASAILQNHASRKQDQGKRYFEAMVKRFNNGTATPRDIAEWGSVRAEVLTRPTTTDHAAITRMCYLDVGTETASYAYSGTHDRPTRFFDEYDDKVVSAESVRLDAIMRNPVVYVAAKSAGFATEFAPARYHMTPYIATSIYRGALGEFAGAAIFYNRSYRQKPMPDGEHERFDGRLIHPDGAWCHVDYKHMDPEKFEGMSEEERRKELSTIAYKLNELQSPGLIIVNMLGDIGSPMRYLNDDLTQNTAIADARVMVIPGLIDRETGSVNVDALLAMERWFRDKGLPQFDGDNENSHA